MVGRVEPGLADVAEPTPVGLEGDRVLAKGFGRVFDRHRLVPHPDGDPFVGEAALPVEPPVAEADRASGVEHARGPQAEQPVEVGRVAARSWAGIVHPWAERARPEGQALGAGPAPIYLAGAALSTADLVRPRGLPTRAYHFMKRCETLPSPSEGRGAGWGLLGQGVRTATSQNVTPHLTTPPPMRSTDAGRNLPA